ncbi:MAG: DUF885 domain-containing protein [Pseudomonadales bacterium]|nr:DUF885 domain-containing protein [Pseudomonadales bacterium]
MKILLAACLLVTALFVHADVKVDDAEATRLHALFAEEWDRQMQASPVWATMLGDRRFNRQWHDLSETARQQRTQETRRTLEKLGSIDRELLSAADRINYDLFERQQAESLEAAQFSQHLMPISQRGGIQTLDETGNRIRLETVQDYDDWLARLATLDTHMAQTIALMEKGIATGMVPPRILMQRVPAQIARQITARPQDSLFFKPFSRISDDIPAAERARIEAEAIEVIGSVVIPAYRRLQTFFNETYLPACRDSVATSALPDGKALYEFTVKRFTTTDMTPQEVHELGLREVARNRSEMAAVMREVGFEGDLKAFNEHLRSRKDFYYDTPEELFDAYHKIAKQIDPLLIRLFGKLPRMPYGIKAIPDAIAPDTTTAYYSPPAADGSRAGYYYVNLYKPETRPKYEMEVLTVHESVPGHHLQIALQQEMETLPDFRRYSRFTVFTEGWGLYSERLGYDLGLYQDPYSRYGQLTYDMWRAIRLVVDTGMHYLGWSRQQAIDYFMENTPKTEQDIVNEIDRYISWPGQALAYKLGQLKLLELRARAEQQLGDKFDIRAFHDRILENGTLPLDVLEKVVNDWIEAQLQQSAA